jgi:hypothetical protein
MIVSRFVGGDYGWMWPFPRAIHRWFDEALAQIQRDAAGQIALARASGDIAEPRR